MLRTSTTMPHRWRTLGLAAGLAALLGSAMLPDTSSAQVAEPLPPPESLKGVPVPEPGNLSQFVADKSAAIRLGKALFWDMQLGSDGKTACASCHFLAGADPRSKNQVSPGLNRLTSTKAPNPDTSFQVGGPNYQFKKSDFPFHKLSNPRDRNSAVLRSFNDIAASQGVFSSQFGGASAGAMADSFTLRGDTVFQKDGLQTRRVEPRNAPTVINAIFNFRNFWDGRANYLFNGVSPFGAEDTAARVYRSDAALVPQPVQVRLDKASMASLATGPGLSEFEMSAAGRTWPHVGRRLLTARPLLQQQVSSSDSVLAAWRDASGMGLTGNYLAMVKAAFRSEWWNSPRLITLGGASYSQAEANFSLFFGLAIQTYAATLVSDDSPFDRFMAGDSTAMTSDAKVGMGLFFSKGKCASCHGGAEFTNASVRNVLNKPLNRMVMGNGGVAVYDEGFYNTAVSRTLEDIANGAKNPVGRPMALTALAQQVDAATFQQLIGIPPNLSVSPTERIAVDGAFKTPTIRNVELTAPYFHNGDALTLRQVVEFYNRGGNHSSNNIANLDPDIVPLGLSETEIGQLVAFMKATTDERVRYERAPFDHPQIIVANGHADAGGVLLNNGGRAKDSELTIPAVGASGRSTPPATFLDVVGGGSYALRPQNALTCFYPAGGFALDGMTIVQWTCGGAMNQQWFEDAVPGGFLVRNSSNGMCMEVLAGSTADYAMVVERTCSSVPHQVFNWSGSSLVASHSGKCVGAAFPGVAQGMAQMSCSGAGAGFQLKRLPN